jgi:hypothetical protein
LFVNFVDGREKSEAEEKKEPENVDPVESCAFSIEHSG